MKKAFTKNKFTSPLSLARLFLFIGLVALTTNASATIRYVKETAAGASDGSTWDNASSDLQAMITASASGDEVWVAKGSYLPVGEQLFRMKQGVKIYGGFAGDEENLTERDLTITDNASTLTGNGKTVVLNYGLNNTASLDGFTITGGADSGIINRNSSHTIKNCSIINNAALRGGGMNNYDSSPVLINCSFRGNTASGDGGAIHNDYSSPKLINCSITNNSAVEKGGGINTTVQSNPILTNCSITGNTASEGGAIYTNIFCSLTLTNSTIAGNSATKGGSLFNYSFSPKLRNCIVYGNSSGMFNYESVPEITHSLVQGITSTDNNNISGNTDPLFVDPANGNYQLQACSPVINKGSNSFYATGQTPDLSAITTDLAGKPRFNNNGIVDMGAYELEYNASIIYVKEGGTGPGTSWGCATGNLQAAIDAAQSGDQVWVAGGTYSGFFSMKEGVSIYGGFEGNETSLTQRDLTSSANGSILKGNSNTVVTASSTSNPDYAALDGFTITGGEESGIVCRNKLIVRNCSITGNRGLRSGGIVTEGPNSFLILINCSILNNSSYGTGGGGLSNYVRGSTTLINCTISGNSGPDAGGIYNSGSQSLKLRNCIVSGNSSGINFATGSPDIQYSLVQGVTSTDGNGNISGNTDPLFVNPANGDYRLQLCSPVINKGSNTYYATGQTPDLTAVTTDLAGNSRFFGNGGTVDMGAYEYNQQPPTTSTIHVDASVANPGNGDSWTTAIRSLAEAIQIAHQSCISIDKILVAEGTYYPEYKAGDGTTDRHKAFTITRKGLEILGGYSTGGSGDRDPNAHPTILTGDLGVVNDNTDNAYHVLMTVGADIDATLKLDGFTIRDGNANGSSGERITVGDFDQIHSVRSGGWYNVYGSPVLNNIKIIDNLATTFGGGVLNEGGSPTVTNATISNNSAQAGAGWYNNVGNPILKNINIQENSATSTGGGWLNNGGSPAIQNMLITGNTATFQGAAWYSYAGNPSLLNSTITGNSGGGSSIQLSFDTNTMNIRNSIVWGPNETDFSGNASEISYANSIVRGSGGSTNWNNSAGYNGNGNLDKDPLFVDPANGNYQLQLCSPAINTGNTALITDQSIPDLAANTRVIGTSVDMGGYEYQLEAEYANVVFVKPGGTGPGTSWDCAMGDLQAAINSAKSGNELWVAGGTYEGSFSMKDSVKIYGGFAGNETSFNLRDLTITANASMLKATGDFVVHNFLNNLSSAAVLDGFTITNARKQGIYNLHSSPTIINCIIKDNSTESKAEYGGGIYNQESSPVITNCLIIGNRARFGGGGIANVNSSSPIITNCTINRNSSPNDGGGIYNETTSSPVIRNTIIYSNSGGIRNYNSDCIPEIKHCLIQGLTSTSDGNISGDTDPLFVDPANGDFHLQLCSPVINKGSNAYYESGQNPDLSTITTDLDGEARFYGNGKVDMGAYEFHQFSTTPVPGVTYVKAGETGTGTSWDCATGDLQAAINAAKSGEEVWVAGGTYQSITYYEYFIMREGVKIYGGFAGNETNLSQRNLTITSNASTLQGTSTSVINNSLYNLSPAAVLDGFTITNGTESGILNRSSSSPTFRNCYIIGNSATSLGGGMHNENSSPVLINCVISGNTALGGGGMYNNEGSSPTLINCTISGNTDNDNAGGGGMYNSGSSPKLLNTIVYGNSSGINDPGTNIRNSLVQGLTSTANGNISGDNDPLFVFPEIGDYRLQPCSPVINKGSDSFYESGQTPDLSAITTDLLGEPRFYGTVDMGAYEFAGTPSTPTLAGNNAEFTQTIFGNTVIGVNGSACTVIASVAPNEGAPLSGDVTAKVWVEATQPTNFVKRHYQLTPTGTGTETATAKVTLYFTQQEFDEFNDANSVKLPVGAEDTDNYKANLRIEKRSGTSSDNSGLPGSYNGTVVTINPLDPAVNGSIIWNTFASRWEVSFDVTGFSGFFAKTTEAALPLNLISFTATKENGVNLLNWKTTNEINTSNFEVQSSSDAKHFTKLTTVPTNGSGNHQYSYQDATPYYGNVYYRLKMVDRDGSFAYSKIISLMNDAIGKATIHPNPAVESITLTISPTLLQSTVTLYDITGRQLQHILLTTNKQQVDVKSLSSGVYILKFADGTAERFVKE